jgi:hypothetical protein
MARAETEALSAPRRAVRRASERALPVVIGFGAPFLAVLLAILVIKPYYGIVDDAFAFGLVRAVHSRGFVHAYWHQFWSDAYGGGQIRPFYWAQEYVEYRAGLHHPTLLYVVNWALTATCLFVAGLGLARALRVPRTRVPFFLGVYGAAVLVFPWTLDLFAFPSPQERWVALSAGVALLWFADARERVPAVAWYGISALVLAFGVLSKATFLVFGPALVLLLLDQRRRGSGSWARFAWVVGLCAAGVALIRIAGAHGGYTSQFSLGNVPDQLHSRYLWLFVLLAAVWAVYVLVRQRRGAGTLLTDLIPLATVAAFVLAYLQWQGWVFHVIGFVAAGSFALVVSRLRNVRLATAVLAASIVWALAWTYIRTGELYGSLASIGEFARSPQALVLARQQVPVYISCEEGSGTIAGYVEREQGTPIRVRPHEAVSSTHAKGATPPPGFPYALVDAHLCPARLSRGEWHVVWKPSRSGGFTLYRRIGS